MTDLDRWPDKMDSKTYKRADPEDQMTADVKARYIIERGYVYSPELRMEELTAEIEKAEQVQEEPKKDEYVYEPVPYNDDTGNIPKKRY